MEKTQKKTTTKTLELPPLHFRADLSPESLDEESRTVEVRWTTGAKVRRGFFEPYDEELSLDPAHVRMERMNNGAPLLNAHNSYDIKDQLGVVVPGSARIGADGGFAKVRFSNRSEVDPIFQDVKDGITRNVSVGYRVHKYQDITLNDDKIKTYRAIDWEPMELSLVPIGADAGASIRSQGYEIRRNECVITTIEPEEKKETVMTVENRSVVEKQVEKQPDLAVERKEAEELGKTQERKRINEIGDLVRKHSLTSEFAQKLINDGVAIEKASKLILDELAERSAKTPINSHFQVGRDLNVESRREGIAEHIMHRVDPSRKLPDVAKEFRGMSLVDIARDTIEFAGGKTRGMTPREIAAVALNMDHALKSRAGMQSTSDFPEILANTMNRTLRESYDLSPRTFLPFCRKATAPNFKEIARTQLSEISAFSKIEQGEEYKSVVFGEQAEKYSLGKYGGIIRITWEGIVNDDLDAFGRIPRAIAAEAAATESDVVYAILTGNPEMADGTALFHADHDNYTSPGTAISDGSLGIGRQKLREQVGVKGRVLNLIPQYLLAGTAKESEANKYTSAMYVASSPSNINPSFNTSLTVIIEPRISGNNWLLIAGTSLVDTIEYAYLEGEEGIFTEQRYGFETDGVEVKARHVFAAKAIDHRGMYLNVGA